MNRIWPDTWIAQSKIMDRFLIKDPPEPGPGECANCGGLGFMYHFNVTGGPFQRPPQGNGTHLEGVGWFAGSTVGEPCPVCSGDRREEFLINLSNLEPDQLEIRLNDFKPLKGKEDAREYAGVILAMTPEPAGFYTFHGNFGTGKTMLLTAIVNGFRIAGVAAVYIRMADLLADVRTGFEDRPKEAAEVILTRYRSYAVMAIDEVDRVNFTPWVRETMFRLLDGRHETQSRTLTVLASNTAPDDLPVDLQYLGSRMNGGIVVEVGGVDVRPALGLRKQKELFTEEPNDGDSI